MPDPLRNDRPGTSRGARRRISELLGERAAQPWSEPDPELVERVMVGLAARPPERALRRDRPAARWLAAAALVALVAALTPFALRDRPAASPPSFPILLQRGGGELALDAPERLLVAEWRAVVVDVRSMVERMSASLPR